MCTPRTLNHHCAFSHRIRISGCKFRLDEPKELHCVLLLLLLLLLLLGTTVLRCKPVTTHRSVRGSGETEAAVLPVVLPVASETTRVSRCRDRRWDAEVVEVIGGRHRRPTVRATAIVRASSGRDSE
eukprot:COSAG01_NODE_43426_length_430_cov_0.534743_1_plen_126_part_10